MMQLKNEGNSDIGACMSFEDIILSAISQSHKDKLYNFTYMS